MAKSKQWPSPMDDAQYRESWEKVLDLRRRHSEAEKAAVDYELKHGTKEPDRLREQATAVLDGSVAVAAPKKTLVRIPYSQSQSTRNANRGQAQPSGDG